MEQSFQNILESIKKLPDFPGVKLTEKDAPQGLSKYSILIEGETCVKNSEIFEGGKFSSSAKQQVRDRIIFGRIIILHNPSIENSHNTQIVLFFSSSNLSELSEDDISNFVLTQFNLECNSYLTLTKTVINDVNLIDGATKTKIELRGSYFIDVDDLSKDIKTFVKVLNFLAQNPTASKPTIMGSMQTEFHTP